MGVILRRQPKDPHRTIREPSPGTTKILRFARLCENSDSNVIPKKPSLIIAQEPRSRSAEWYWYLRFPPPCEFSHSLSLRMTPAPSEPIDRATGELGGVAELLLDAQQLIVLRDAVGS